MSAETELLIVFSFLHALSLALAIVGGYLIGYSKGKAQPKPDENIGTSCDYCIEYEDELTNIVHKYNIPASNEADALTTFMAVYTNFTIYGVNPIGQRYKDYD